LLIGVVTGRDSETNLILLARRLLFIVGERSALDLALRCLKALLVSGLATALTFPLYPRVDLVNIAMVYLLGTAWSGLRFGRGASALCAVASVAAFDFFFVPPRFSFDVADAQYLFALVVMLAVGLVIAHLTASVHEFRGVAERAKLCNTLLASISHDLRGPLTTIAGAGSLVAGTGDAMDRQRRMLLGELIERNAREMTGLLNNVLELMRLETVKGPIHAEWESLEELVAAAWKRNEQQLAHLRVVTRIASQLPPVYVDAQLIVQLFSNLLENASKYTPAGTCVTVAAELRSGAVQVSLEDEGPGFGPRDPESLFGMFERGSERGPRGTGLGLAICRAIARLHGGEIRAMAGPRGGARFEIALPLRADAPAMLQGA